MKKIRVIKHFFAGTFILLLVFTPISFAEIFSGEYFKAKAYGEKIISGYEEWTIDQEIDGLVQVEPDATLVIKNGVTVTFKEESSFIKDILAVSVFSPIDIQVEAPDGKRVGKDFTTGEIINEISGAYYSGAGAENEFLTIPNPLDGEYKIRTQGTDNGEYKIEAAKITADPATGMAGESAVEITGNAILGQEEEKEIKIAGNEVSAEDQDTLVPEISITTPEENKTYRNNQNLKINYAVADNVSQNIQAEVFLDGNIFSKENIDLSLQNLGEHKLKIIATDEAGNRAEKEISFQTATDIETIIDNVNHYAALNLIKNKADKTVLISRLKLIGEVEKLKKIIENSRFFKAKIKEKLIKSLEEQINRQLDWLIKYVEQRSRSKIKNGIDPLAGNLLVESLNFIKI
jgi:hypothetical protein